MICIASWHRVTQKWLLIFQLFQLLRNNLSADRWYTLEFNPAFGTFVSQFLISQVDLLDSGNYMCQSTLASESASVKVHVLVDGELHWLTVLIKIIPIFFNRADSEVLRICFVTIWFNYIILYWKLNYWTCMM